MRCKGGRQPELFPDWLGPDFTAIDAHAHFDDQAAMFARGEMKPIRWTDADIEVATIRRYRPGEEGRR